jgi:hypothetical protein
LGTDVKDKNLCEINGGLFLTDLNEFDRKLTVNRQMIFTKIVIFA